MQGRLITWALVGLALLMAQPALAVGVEKPRDAAGVESAQQWLAHDWRRCRLAAYPSDPMAGVPKVSTTLRLRGKRRKVKARLAITLHEQDGKKRKMTRKQKRFVRCVKKAFGKRRFVRRGAPKGPIVVANPHPGRPFSRGGRLSHMMAQRQVALALHKARRACRMRKVKGPLQLTLKVQRDGSATDFAIQGASKRQARCIQRRLKRTLRFPKIRAPIELKVP